MTNRTKTVTAALGGAVALASVAYAIGTQAGDGAATAAAGGASLSESAQGRPAAAMRLTHLRGGPAGAGLESLAEDLGVTEAKLRAALQAVREDQEPKGEKDTAIAAALAKALGKTTDEVTKAMETVRDQRQSEFAAALAKSLGIDAAKVRAALEATEPDPGERRRHGGPGARFGDLAEELGVSQARLRRALRAALPRMDRDDPGERRRGPGGPHLRFGNSEELAKALGVTTEQLEDASDEVAKALEAEHAKRRAAFVAALAKELGISEDKVADALPDRPFGGPGFHHRGPGPR